MTIRIIRLSCFPFGATSALADSGGVRIDEQAAGGAFFALGANAHHGVIARNLFSGGEI
jgi:hypothetical protein